MRGLRGEEEKLQKKEAGTPQAAAGEAPASVHEVLRSPGQPLDAATRAYFEPRFGHDFRRCGCIPDAAAEQSARDVNAHAYTVGHDIVFGAGRFTPGTHEGRRLLAHELTHVVQESGGTPARLLMQRTPAGSGQGATPVSSHPSRSRKLRLTIVGHASPRWRGAASNTEADRLNEKLANQRADAVRAKVEQLLRQRLGQERADQTTSPWPPARRSPGSHFRPAGRGSREALQEEHKKRRSDDEYDRRVDVNIELATTEDVRGGRSLPSKQATSRHWSVSINEFKLLRALGAAGGIQPAIRNRQTGKEVLATAKLYGGAWFKMNPFSTKEETGTRRHGSIRIPISPYRISRGTEVDITRVDAKVGLGVTFLYLTFPSIAPYKGLTMYHHFSFGLPSGSFHVWGNLHLWGDTSDEVDQKDVVGTTVEHRSKRGLDHHLSYRAT